MLSLGNECAFPRISMLFGDLIDCRFLLLLVLEVFMHNLCGGGQRQRFATGLSHHSECSSRLYCSGDPFVCCLASRYERLAIMSMSSVLYGLLMPQRDALHFCVFFPIQRDVVKSASRYCFLTLTCRETAFPHCLFVASSS